ncbi:MAG: ABC transporter permease [Geminicoccaceae bacterium]|nr:ABC transporter permease [Geminicoccaceae bacterium]
MASLRITFRLGLKELWAVLRDPVLLGLVAYTFTIAIVTVARGVRTEVRDAAIAVVDLDQSPLSNRLVDAFLPPWFKPARAIELAEVERVMERGEATFVLLIPAGFEADLLAAREPELALLVDATAMTLAGNGAAYARAILEREIARFLGREVVPGSLPIRLEVRARFNPNLEAGRFLAVTQLVNNLTILAIVLAGAAVIREREHGTLEHLLTLPLRPVEVVAAKLWANGLLVLVAALLSLEAVVRGVLAVPLAGSPLLFAFGAAVYLLAVTALGVMLSTVATTMPRFGLLAIPVFVILNLLSGGFTPLESMPRWLQLAMQLSPTTHLVAFAQGVLFRGAGLDVLWPRILAMALIGAGFAGLALLRFRRTIAAVA